MASGARWGFIAVKILSRCALGTPKMMNRAPSNVAARSVLDQPLGRAQGPIGCAGARPRSANYQKRRQGSAAHGGKWRSDCVHAKPSSSLLASIPISVMPACAESASNAETAVTVAASRATAPTGERRRAAIWQPGVHAQWSFVRGSPFLCFLVFLHSVVGTST